MAPRVELFPFSLPRSGKWKQARYVATREEIAARNAEWEITGAPEIRDVDPAARYLSPWQCESATGNTSIGNLGPMLAIVHRTDRPFRWSQSLALLLEKSGRNALH